MDTQVLGISVDSTDCLRAWAEHLSGITYPLLSDFWPHGKAAETYGVLRSEGYSERALFVIDKSGFIRYIDIHDIDKQPDNDVLFGVLEQLEPRLASFYRAKVAQEKPVVTEIPSDVALVMYCTPWCPACRRARLWLNQHNIRYADVDITRDRQAAMRVRGWANGAETTPTFDVKGTIVVEFKQARLAELLGIRE
ncbi:MAG: redoxin domain-containing protein [Anaerolineales bacterium]|nr:redoxin domain-containing protein [Anaerolineales bacterium]